MKKERIFRDRLIIDHYVRQECLTYLKRKKKSPLTSLAGSGRACFYACFFTLCQAGMPNVLEESPNVVTDYYHTRNKKEEFRLRQRSGRSSKVLECGSSEVEEVEEKKK